MKYYAYYSIFGVNLLIFIIYEIIYLFNSGDVFANTIIISTVHVVITTQLLWRDVDFSKDKVIIRYPFSLFFKTKSIPYEQLRVILDNKTGRSIPDTMTLTLKDLNSKRVYILHKIIHSFDYYSATSLCKALSLALKNGAKLEFQLYEKGEKKIRRILQSEGIEI